MCSLGCPLRNASLKVAYYEVPIPGRFSLLADTMSRIAKTTIGKGSNHMQNGGQSARLCKPVSCYGHQFLFLGLWMALFSTFVGDVERQRAAGMQRL
jgi:hypothetical protein